MFQFSGWLVIQGSAVDEDDVVLQSAIGRMSELIDSFSWNTGRLDLSVINGAHFLLIAGLANHRGGDAEDLDRLLKFISENAPGSYGLVHVWDDEVSSWPGRDAFRVIVMRKGVLTEQDDPFFSPVIPVIEDE